MADYTIPGLIAIVVIVLISALFLQAPSATGEVQASGSTLAGEVTGEMSSASTCEPARYCSGTKLVIVREDCSLAQAHCRSGCVEEPVAVCA